MQDLYDLHELDYISPYVRRAIFIQRGNHHPTGLSNETENVLLYIVRGSFIHIAEGHTTELSEGMMRIIPPYADQVVNEITSDDLEFYCIYFDLFDGAESRSAIHRDPARHLPERELFFSKHHTLGRVEPPRRDALRRHLDFIVSNHTSAPSLTMNLQLKSAMISVLVEFFCAQPLNTREEHTVLSRYVSKALHYVDHNFASPTLSVAEIAAHLGISTAHLSRLVKQHTGIPLSEYITKVRINKAKDLFALGKRISDVARRCGFLSLQSFSRTFRRVEGISPRTYLGGTGRQKSFDSPDNN